MNIKFITIIITLEGIEKNKTEKKTEKNITTTKRGWLASCNDVMKF